MTNDNDTSLHLHPRDGDILEISLRLGIVAVLGYWGFEIIRPFGPIFIWSAVLTVALYPVFSWFSARLAGARWLAALLTTLLTLAIVIGPMTWLSLSLADGVRQLIALLSAGHYAVPPPPDKLKEWPLVGEPLYTFWALASTNLQSALAYMLPELKSFGEIMLSIVSRAGTGALQFLASVIVAGFLFSPGPQIVAVFKLMARRVDAGLGEEFVEIAGATIRAVSRGVIGVSVLQALLAGVGMSLAAVPGSDLLTFAFLVFGIVQLGPIWLAVPLVIWSWVTMPIAYALAFTACMAAVYALEAFLKPFAMAHGLNTPMPVIFVGVIGGIFAYGVLGLFAGPIILALVWELAKVFVNFSKLPRPD